MTTFLSAADAPLDAASVKLAATLPFGAALAFLLISPLLIAKVKQVLIGQIIQETARFGVTPDTEVPPPLNREFIEDYVEYVSDAVQILPLTLLPVPGALLAVWSRIPTPATITILSSATIGVVAAEAWILSKAASDYVSRKKWGYSIVTAIGVFVNLVGLVIVLVYG